MAEVSRILIKSSTQKPSPNTGTLQRAELAYSYASNKLFIGDQFGQDVHVIGGSNFLDLFKDVLDDNGNVNAGIVYPYNVIVADANNTINELNIQTLKINGRELVTGSIEELITDNTLPNVTDTKLISSKATKEYIDNRTSRFLNNFDESSLEAAQLLVVNANNVFENKEITGALKFFSNGYSTISDSFIENQMLKNKFIRIGTQKINLGEGTLVNLNLDTSGVLNVPRGGIGRYNIEKDYVLLGNGINSVSSTNDFIFDTSSNNNLLYANANAQITLNASIGETLSVADSLFASTNMLKFRDFFQILTVGGENSFDSSIITYDVISEYFSFSSGTVLNISDAGLVNVNSPTLFFGNELTTSSNTTTNIYGLLYVNNDTEFNGNTLTISDTTNTFINGIAYLNNDTFINGNTFNVSSNTETIIDGVSTFNDDVTINSLLTVNDNVEITGNLIVESDLFVKGNTVEVNTESLLVEDNIIVLGSNNETDIVDLGFASRYNNGIVNLYAGLFRDASDGKFYLFEKYPTEPPISTMVGFDISTMLATLYGNFEANNIIAYSGTLDNVTITSSNILNSTSNNLIVDNGTINTSTFNNGTINTSYINDSYSNNVVSNNSIINTSTFNNGSINSTNISDSYSNNLIVDNGTINASYINDSYSNNVVSNNSIINTSTFNNGTIDSTNISNSTSNNLIVDNGTINTSTFNNGTIDSTNINDSYSNNLYSNNSTIENTAISNANISNSYSNNVVSNNSIINTSTFNNGTIDSTNISNSTSNNLIVDNGTINTSSISNANIYNSYSNNLYSNNSTIENTTISNTNIYNSYSNNLVSNNATINYATLSDVIVNNLTSSNSSLNDSLANNFVGNNVILYNTEVYNINSNNLIANNSTLDTGTIINYHLSNSYANNLVSNNTTFNGNSVFNDSVLINNDLRITNDLHVDGNFYLTGNTVSLDAQTLLVEDNIIVLGSNNTADILDLGFAGKYNDGASDLYAGIFRDATNGKFYLFENYNTAPGTTMTGYDANTMLSTLYGNFEANNIQVSSGYIDNVSTNNSIIINSTISDSIIDCGTY